MTPHHAVAHSSNCLGPALLLRGAKGVVGWVGRHVLRRRPGAAAHLPLDCWGVIAGFLANDVLAEVNAFLRAHIPRRHVNVVINSANASRVTGAYLGNTTVRAMTLRCKGLSEDEGHNLAVLADMPLLERLSVELFVHQYNNSAADATVEALSALSDAEELRHLHLDLHCGIGGRGSGNLTDAAGISLAELRKSTSLETLCIDLSWNHFGPTTGKALATLAAAPALTSLELKLTSTLMRDEGVAALAALKRSRTLESLLLNLRCTGVSDEGVKALAGLRDAPALKCLQLDLGCSKVGDAGLRCLIAALKCAPGLSSLTLVLTSTAVTEGGLRCLAELREAPALQHLTLVLGPDVTDSTAEALRALAHAPRLRTLCLDLSHSKLTDLGAQLLAGLKESRTLEALALDLSHSMVADSGADCLAELQDCRTLQGLTIDLRMTLAQARGVRALRELKFRRAWQRLDIIYGFSTVGPLCWPTLPLTPSHAMAAARR
eukprot:EG_transcript_6890